MAEQSQRAGARPTPLPAAAEQLLRRADTELLAARFTFDDDERFVHAHLAALRAAAAVVAVRGRTASRGGPRAVWDLLARTAPEFEAWTAYFASGAAERAAIESGGVEVVSTRRAGEILAAAEDFVDEVRMALEPAGQGRGGGDGRGLVSAVEAS